MNGLPWWLSVKEFACQCRRQGFHPWSWKIPWTMKCQPTPVFLPGKSHGQRSLAGYSLWGYKEWDMTATTAKTITWITLFMVCCLGNRKNKVHVYTEISQSCYLNNNTYCKMSFANGYFVCHLYIFCSKMYTQVFCALIVTLLLLLSHFSHVQLCATPSLRFSRQEHWSGLPFPSPMDKSEKWKWSRSVMSDSSWPHGLQPTRLLCPWDFPGKSTGVGCHWLLLYY